MRPLLRQAASALLVVVACHTQAQGGAAASVEASGDAVIFNGRISPHSAAEFLGLLQDPGVKRVVITSAGGIVSAALDMALAIHARQLDVEVPLACDSSCANYIFPAGRRKTLGRPGAVTWHGTMTHVLYLQQTGQGTWSPKEIADARELARRETEFFRRVGVDGFVGWFAKIEPYNVDDFYYLSLEDMARFGLRDVTLRDAAAPPREAVRLVSVDWTRLEADRPAVRLDE